MMKKVGLLLIVSFFTVVSCGGGVDLRNTVLAAEAMEKAREVNAPKLAPKEYRIAARLFDDMNRELDQERYKDANNTALLVIEAANEAIRVARLIKDTEK